MDLDGVLRIGVSSKVGLGGVLRVGVSCKVGLGGVCGLMSVVKWI